MLTVSFTRTRGTYKIQYNNENAITGFNRIYQTRTIYYTTVVRKLEGLKVCYAFLIQLGGNQTHRFQQIMCHFVLNKYYIRSQWFNFIRITQRMIDLECSSLENLF